MLSFIYLYIIVEELVQIPYINFFEQGVNYEGLLGNRF